MELIPHEEQAVQTNQIDALARIAKSFALSDYFSDLRGDPDKKISQAFTKIITGAEFGVPASAAIRGIHIINGKPAISAGLMSGLIKRSTKYDYRVVENSDTVCRIDCFEIIDGKREKIGTAEWTMEKAKKAGLAGGANWKKFPDRMLFARAISEACTIYFPDLLLGNVYTPEELEEVSFTEVEDDAPQQPARQIEAPPPIDYDAKIRSTHDWLKGKLEDGPEAVIEAQEKAVHLVKDWPDEPRNRALDMIGAFDPDTPSGDGVENVDTTTGEVIEEPDFFQEPA